MEKLLVENIDEKIKEAMSLLNKFYDVNEYSDRYGWKFDPLDKLNDVLTDLLERKRVKIEIHDFFTKYRNEICLDGSRQVYCNNLMETLKIPYRFVSDFENQKCFIVVEKENVDTAKNALINANFIRGRSENGDA